MTALKIVLTIIFVIICIALSVIILMQEGKSSGLGSVAGMADTYWGKNKGRSREAQWDSWKQGCFFRQREGKKQGREKQGRRELRQRKSKLVMDLGVLSGSRE